MNLLLIIIVIITVIVIGFILFRVFIYGKNEKNKGGVLHDISLSKNEYIESFKQRCNQISEFIGTRKSPKGVDKVPNINDGIYKEVHKILYNGIINENLTNETYKEMYKIAEKEEADENTQKNPNFTFRFQGVEGVILKYFNNFSYHVIKFIEKKFDVEKQKIDHADIIMNTKYYITRLIVLSAYKLHSEHHSGYCEIIYKNDKNPCFEETVTPEYMDEFKAFVDNEYSAIIDEEYDKIKNHINKDVLEPIKNNETLLRQLLKVLDNNMNIQNITLGWNEFENKFKNQSQLQQHFMEPKKVSDELFNHINQKSSQLDSRILKLMCTNYYKNKLNEINYYEDERYVEIAEDFENLVRSDLYIIENFFFDPKLDPNFEIKLKELQLWLVYDDTFNKILCLCDMLPLGVKNYEDTNDSNVESYDLGIYRSFYSKLKEGLKKIKQDTSFCESIQDNDDITGIIMILLRIENYLDDIYPIEVIIKKINNSTDENKNRIINILKTIYLHMLRSKGTKNRFKSYYKNKIKELCEFNEEDKNNLTKLYNRDIDTINPITDIGLKNVLHMPINYMNYMEQKFNNIINKIHDDYIRFVNNEKMRTYPTDLHLSLYYHELSQSIEALLKDEQQVNGGSLGKIYLDKDREKGFIICGRLNIMEIQKLFHELFDEVPLLKDFRDECEINILAMALVNNDIWSLINDDKSDSLKNEHDIIKKLTLINYIFKYGSEDHCYSHNFIIYNMLYFKLVALNKTSKNITEIQQTIKKLSGEIENKIKEHEKNIKPYNNNDFDIKRYISSIDSKNTTIENITSNLSMLYNALFYCYCYCYQDGKIDGIENILSLSDKHLQYFINALNRFSNEIREPNKDDIVKTIKQLNSILYILILFPAFAEKKLQCIDNNIKTIDGISLTDLTKGEILGIMGDVEGKINTDINMLESQITNKTIDELESLFETNTESIIDNVLCIYYNQYIETFVNGTNDVSSFLKTHMIHLRKKQLLHHQYSELGLDKETIESLEFIKNTENDYRVGNDSNTSQIFSIVEKLEDTTNTSLSPATAGFNELVDHGLNICIKKACSQMSNNGETKKLLIRFVYKILNWTGITPQIHNFWNWLFINCLGPSLHSIKSYLLEGTSWVSWIVLGLKIMDKANKFVNVRSKTKQQTINNSIVSDAAKIVLLTNALKSLAKAIRKINDRLKIDDDKVYNETINDLKNFCESHVKSNKGPNIIKRGALSVVYTLGVVVSSFLGFVKQPSQNINEVREQAYNEWNDWNPDCSKYDLDDTNIDYTITDDEINDIIKRCDEDDKQTDMLLKQNTVLGPERIDEILKKKDLLNHVEQMRNKINKIMYYIHVLFMNNSNNKNIDAYIVKAVNKNNTNSKELKQQISFALVTLKYNIAKVIEGSNMNTIAEEDAKRVNELERIKLLNYLIERIKDPSNTTFRFDANRTMEYAVDISLTCQMTVLSINDFCNRIIKDTLIRILDTNRQFINSASLTQYIMDNKNVLLLTANRTGKEYVYDEINGLIDDQINKMENGNSLESILTIISNINEFGANDKNYKAKYKPCIDKILNMCNSVKNRYEYLKYSLNNPLEALPFDVSKYLKTIGNGLSAISELDIISNHTQGIIQKATDKTMDSIKLLIEKSQELSDMLGMNNPAIIDALVSRIIGSYNESEIRLEGLQELIDFYQRCLLIDNISHVYLYVLSQINNNHIVEMIYDIISRIKNGEKHKMLGIDEKPTPYIMSSFTYYISSYNANMNRYDDVSSSIYTNFRNVFEEIEKRATENLKDYMKNISRSDENDLEQKINEKLVEIKKINLLGGIVRRDTVKRILYDKRTLIIQTFVRRIVNILNKFEIHHFSIGFTERQTMLSFLRNVDALVKAYYNESIGESEEFMKNINKMIYNHQQRMKGDDGDDGDDGETLYKTMCINMNLGLFKYVRNTTELIQAQNDNVEVDMTYPSDESTGFIGKIINRIKNTATSYVHEKFPIDFSHALSMCAYKMNKNKYRKLKSTTYNWLDMIEQISCCLNGVWDICSFFSTGKDIWDKFNAQRNLVNDIKKTMNKSELRKLFEKDIKLLRGLTSNNDTILFNETHEDLNESFSKVFSPFQNNANITRALEYNMRRQNKLIPFQNNANITRALENAEMDIYDDTTQTNDNTEMDTYDTAQLIDDRNTSLLYKAYGIYSTDDESGETEDINDVDPHNDKSAIINIDIENMESIFNIPAVMIAIVNPKIVEKEFPEYFPTIQRKIEKFKNKNNSNEFALNSIKRDFEIMINDHMDRIQGKKTDSLAEKLGNILHGVELNPDEFDKAYWYFSRQLIDRQQKGYWEHYVAHYEKTYVKTLLERLIPSIDMKDLEEKWNMLSSLNNKRDNGNYKVIDDVYKNFRQELHKYYVSPTKNLTLEQNIRMIYPNLKNKMNEYLPFVVKDNIKAQIETIGKSDENFTILPNINIPQYVEDAIDLIKDCSTTSEQQAIIRIIENEIDNIAKIVLDGFNITEDVKKTIEDDVMEKIKNDLVDITNNNYNLDLDESNRLRELNYGDVIRGINNIRNYGRVLIGNDRPSSADLRSVDALYNNFPNGIANVSNSTTSSRLSSNNETFEYLPHSSFNRFAYDDIKTTNISIGGKTITEQFNPHTSEFKIVCELQQIDIFPERSINATHTTEIMNKVSGENTKDLFDSLQNGNIFLYQIPLLHFFVIHKNCEYNYVNGTINIEYIDPLGEIVWTYDEKTATVKSRFSKHGKEIQYYETCSKYDTLVIGNSEITWHKDKNEIEIENGNLSAIDYVHLIAESFTKALVNTEFNVKAYNEGEDKDKNYRIVIKSDNNTYMYYERNTDENNETCERKDMYELSELDEVKLIRSDRTMKRNIENETIEETVTVQKLPNDDYEETYENPAGTLTATLRQGCKIKESFVAKVPSPNNDKPLEIKRINDMENNRQMVLLLDNMGNYQLSKETSDTYNKYFDDGGNLCYEDKTNEKGNIVSKFRKNGDYTHNETITYNNTIDDIKKYIQNTKIPKPLEKHLSTLNGATIHDCTDDIDGSNVNYTMIEKADHKLMIIIQNMPVTYKNDKDEPVLEMRPVRMIFQINKDGLSGSYIVDANATNFKDEKLILPFVTSDRKTAFLQMNFNEWNNKMNIIKGNELNPDELMQMLHPKLYQEFSKEYDKPDIFNFHKFHLGQFFNKLTSQLYVNNNQNYEAKISSNMEKYIAASVKNFLISYKLKGQVHFESWNPETKQYRLSIENMNDEDDTVNDRKNRFLFNRIVGQDEYDKKINSTILQDLIEQSTTPYRVKGDNEPTITMFSTENVGKFEEFKTALRKAGISSSAIYDIKFGWEKAQDGSLVIYVNNASLIEHNDKIKDTITKAASQLANNTKNVKGQYEGAIDNTTVMVLQSPFDDPTVHSLPSNETNEIDQQKINKNENVFIITVKQGWEHIKTPFIWVKNTARSGWEILCHATNYAEMQIKSAFQIKPTRVVIEGFIEDNINKVDIKYIRDAVYRDKDFIDTVKKCANETFDVLYDQLINKNLKNYDDICDIEGLENDGNWTKTLELLNNDKYKNNSRLLILGRLIDHYKNDEAKKNKVMDIYSKEIQDHINYYGEYEFQMNNQGQVLSQKDTNAMFNYKYSDSLAKSVAYAITSFKNLNMFLDTNRALENYLDLMLDLKNVTNSPDDNQRVYDSRVYKIYDTQGYVIKISNGKVTTRYYYNANKEFINSVDEYNGLEKGVIYKFNGHVENNHLVKKLDGALTYDALTRMISGIDKIGAIKEAKYDMTIISGKQAIVEDPNVYQKYDISGSDGSQIEVVDFHNNTRSIMSFKDNKETRITINLTDNSILERLIWNDESIKLKPNENPFQSPVEINLDYIGFKIIDENHMLTYARSHDKRYEIYKITGMKFNENRVPEKIDDGDKVYGYITYDENGEPIKKIEVFPNRKNYNGDELDEIYITTIKNDDGNTYTLCNKFIGYKDIDPELSSSYARNITKSGISLKHEIYKPTELEGKLFNNLNLTNISKVEITNEDKLTDRRLVKKLYAVSNGNGHYEVFGWDDIHRKICTWGELTAAAALAIGAIATTIGSGGTSTPITGPIAASSGTTVAVGVAAKLSGIASSLLSTHFWSNAAISYIIGSWTNSVVKSFLEDVTYEIPKEMKTIRGVLGALKKVAEVTPYVCSNKLLGYTIGGLKICGEWLGNNNATQRLGAALDFIGSGMMIISDLKSSGAQNLLRTLFVTENDNINAMLKDISKFTNSTAVKYVPAIFEKAGTLYCCVAELSGVLKGAGAIGSLQICKLSTALKSFSSLRQIANISGIARETITTCIELGGSLGKSSKQLMDIFGININSITSAIKQCLQLHQYNRTQLMIDLNNDLNKYSKNPNKKQLDESLEKLTLIHKLIEQENITQDSKVKIGKNFSVPIANKINELYTQINETSKPHAYHKVIADGSEVHVLDDNNKSYTLNLNNGTFFCFDNTPGVIYKLDGNITYAFKIDDNGNNKFRFADMKPTFTGMLASYISQGYKNCKIAINHAKTLYSYYRGLMNMNICMKALMHYAMKWTQKQFDHFVNSIKGKTIDVMKRFAEFIFSQAQTNMNWNEIHNTTDKGLLTREASDMIHNFDGTFINNLLEQDTVKLFGGEFPLINDSMITLAYSLKDVFSCLIEINNEYETLRNSKNGQNDDILENIYNKSNNKVLLLNSKKKKSILELYCEMFEKWSVKEDNKVSFVLLRPKTPILKPRCKTTPLLQAIVGEINTTERTPLKNLLLNKNNTIYY